jgi:hypothetical protein
MLIGNPRTSISTVCVGALPTKLNFLIHCHNQGEYITYHGPQLLVIGIYFSIIFNFFFRERFILVQITQIWSLVVGGGGEGLPVIMNPRDVKISSGDKTTLLLIMIADNESQVYKHLHYVLIMPMGLQLFEHISYKYVTKVLFHWVKFLQIFTCDI